MQEHLFLGIDKRDAEAQRDLWLSQNPAIKVIKIYGVRREPPSLLTRIGGKRVPRVSILVEYEASGPHFAARRLPSAALSEESPREKCAYGSGNQSYNEHLFAAKPP